MNKSSERTIPSDFELLKTLGKGGYGKVMYIYTSRTRAICAPAFSLYIIIMKIITNGGSLLFA